MPRTAKIVECDAGTRKNLSSQILIKKLRIENKSSLSQSRKNHFVATLLSRPMWARGLIGQGKSMPSASALLSHASCLCACFFSFSSLM